MLSPQSDRQLRPHYAHKTRSLEQAAHSAHVIAEAEQLPINAAPVGDPEEWHRHAILQTVTVYGLRDRHKERVPATAKLDGNHAAADQGQWSELMVKDVDFQRYLKWLHSFW